MSGGNRRSKGGENRRAWPTVMLTVTIVVTLLASLGSVRASGTGNATPEKCPPSCPPPTCPTPYTFSYTSSVQVNPTNVTIQYGGGVTWNSYTNVSFGLNTSYTYPSETNQVMAGSGPNYVFVNYLDPSTTYYYKLVGWASCADSKGNHIYHGTYTGQWTTGSEETYLNQYHDVIQGIVSNANGGLAPAGIQVTVSCTDGGDYSYTGSTNANGEFWLIANPVTYPENIPYCTNYGFGYFQVQVGAPNTMPWNGYWNETVITWAPQFVNLALPENYVTSYTPGILDFSNAPAQNGYTSLEVDQGTGYENTYTYDWSVGAQVIGIGGGASGSSASGTGVTANIGWQATQQSLCVAYLYDVTGTVLFTAITRSWEFGQTLFDAHNGEFCNQLGVSVPANWFDNQSNANEDIHPMPGPPSSAWTSGLLNVPLWEGDSIPYELTISSSTSATTGVSFDFDISGSLAGVIPLSFQASEGWSQTVTSSSSTELAYDIEGPSTTAVSCYNVFGEGGSLAADTADLIAIYYWTGSVVNGHPVCT